MIIEIIYWVLIILFLSLLGLPLSNILFLNSKLLNKFIFALPLAFITTGIISLLIFLLSGSLVTGCILSISIHLIFLFNLLRSKNILELKYIFLTYLKLSFSVIVLFSSFLILRGFNIGLTGTEKLSDQMHLSSIYWANNGIIKDLWFSGQENPYYFYGYWMYGSIMRTFRIDPILCYSLILATTMAMSALVSWSSSVQLIKYSGLKFKYVKLIAVLSPLTLLFITNYSILWEILNILKFGQPIISDFININGLNENSGLSGSGWRSTRIINYFSNNIQYDYTIQEYPSFSFHLGDLHPHFISIPYVIIFLTLIFNLFTNIKEHKIKKIKIQSTFIGLMIPILGLINIWDLPLAVFIFLAGLIYMRIYIKKFNYISLLYYALGGVLLGFITLSKYYLFTLGGQTEFPFIEVNKFGTNLVHFLTIWGLFIALIYFNAGINGYIGKKIIFKNIINSIIISLIIITSRLSINILRGSEIFFDSYLYSIMTLGLLIFPILLIIEKKNKIGSNQKNYLLNIVIICCFGILIIIENIHLIDSFGNRMNTIFKAYYQVWIILSLATPAIMINIMNRYKGLGILKVFYVFIGITICLSFVQNYSLLKDNSNNFSKDFGFNNLDHMDKKIPGFAGSVNFLINNTDENSIIYSGIGKDYTNSSLFSVFTGRATPLGWPGHESQWRGNNNKIYERESDLTKIESSNNGNEILKIIKKYNIDYYIVYKDKTINPKLQEMFLNIYSNNQVKIYQTLKIKN